MRKVACMTSVHSAFDVRIFHKECRSLSNAGYRTVLLAPHNRDEEVEGIQIRALPKVRGRRARMTRTVWQAYRAALAEGARIYHIHDPELIPIGLLLRLMGARVIYDVHEDLPRQVMSKHWIPKWLRGIVAKGAGLTEWVAARLLSGVVAATPAIARRFPPHKTVVVQNYPIPEEFEVSNAMPWVQRPFKVVYVGVISSIRGIFEMVKAIELIPARLNVRLALAGRFSPARLADDVAKLPGWARVEFLGWRSRHEVAALLADARIGLVLFHPVPNHIEAQPNKLFEFMAAGIPVIASDFPLWRRIVEETKSGLLVDPLSPAAIANAIRWMMENPEEAEAMGRRGQEAVRERYNWNSEARKLVEFYRRLA